MPLYLARGPATNAFLIRARDRESFEGEPAFTSPNPDQPNPDLRVSFRGSSELETLLVLPMVDPYE